ncbi:hypothetical protein BB934_00985 [Microvirga ossetica]|uniref:Uncharacterized protein n=1 Tax=Microvirga ossetica TaxID=1882682 RepID=A0A1B2EAF6_9HYPH|nr:hypothetical protein [Microvirga ossetica]ANY76966.1 hypothetical protein BB934_00985 [Microvirga ossetica]
MAVHVKYPLGHRVPNADGFYSSDILPLLQNILAELADLDFAHEKNLNRIRQSAADDAEKSAMIVRLRRQHRDMREPFVHELTTLRERIDTIFR